MINRGILIQNPIGPEGRLGRIPQIKHEFGPGPKVSPPSSPHDNPHPSLPPPEPALRPPLPSPLPHRPTASVAEPVPLLPSAAVRVARAVRKLERIVAVQVKLSDQVVALGPRAAGLRVLPAQVVAEQLLVRGVEPDARRKRKRRRIGISH